MGVVQIPEDVKQVIDRQIEKGRSANEAEFLAEAVTRYAAALELDEEETMNAAREGIADIEAGRFELIDGPADMDRFQAKLSARLDALAGERGPASR
jgi:Arc/MetJ-type ribon-helix-helix transcriptional regulator